jgi:hypothetical protein
VEADIANPALADLAFLIGDWDMALSGASFLADKDQVLHGRAEFRSIEAGTLVVLRQGVEPPNPPQASWVIGRDDSRDHYAVLYADPRGVSRVYEMMLSDSQWRIWRDNPHFAQRFEATISTDRNEIVGRWEKRSSKAVWEHDFNLTYTRRL